MSEDHGHGDHSTSRRGLYLAAALAVTSVMLATLAACRRTESAPPAPAFATPQAAVIELAKAVKGGDLAKVMAIFGPDAQALVDTSDPVTARRNQQVFSVAFSEYWRVVPAGLGRATLVVGFEEWPFPIPLVKDGGKWRFDTAAGKEEILARRIGRNELAAIRICRTYVAAQRLYARYGHDGKPAGIYAAAFRSDPARENGLYWQARHGQRRSPLGDLLAAASIDRRRASRVERRAAALPRLLLPHPHGARGRGVRRCAGLRRRWETHRRLRARCLAGAVRRDRNRDLRGQPGRRRLRAGSRAPKPTRPRGPSRPTTRIRPGRPIADGRPGVAAESEALVTRDGISSGTEARELRGVPRRLRGGGTRVTEAISSA